MNELNSLRAAVVEWLKSNMHKIDAAEVNRLHEIIKPAADGDLPRRRGDAFRAQAKKLGLESWTLGTCLACRHGRAYFFKYGRVSYENFCDCLDKKGFITKKRTWDDVANYYNAYKDEKHINEMNEFWRF